MLAAVGNIGTEVGQAVTLALQQYMQMQQQMQQQMHQQQMHQQQMNQQQQYQQPQQFEFESPSVNGSSATRGARTGGNVIRRITDNNSNS
jgi:hypothetical protein